MSNNILFVIPARYKSLRLSGKLLKPLWGSTSLELVWKAVKGAARSGDKVVVAIESEEAQRYCEDKSIDYVTTSEFHMTGTDRAAEVSRTLPQFEQVVIVSADLPHITSKEIEEVIQEVETSNPEILQVVTASDEYWEDESRVKVEMRRGHLTGFYRRPHKTCHTSLDFITVGIYSYKKEILEEFVNTERPFKEKESNMESFRLFDKYSKSIKLLYLPGVSPVSLDTAKDYQYFLERGVSQKPS